MQSCEAKQALRTVVGKGFEHDQVWEVIPKWLKNRDFIRIQRNVALANLFEKL